MVGPSFLAPLLLTALFYGAILAGALIVAGMVLIRYYLSLSPAAGHGRRLGEIGSRLDRLERQVMEAEE